MLTQPVQVQEPPAPESQVQATPETPSLSKLRQTCKASALERRLFPFHRKQATSLHQSWVIDQSRVHAYVCPKGVSPMNVHSPEETAHNRDKRTTRPRTRRPDPPTRVRTLRGKRPRGRPRTGRLAPRERGNHDQEIPNRHRLIAHTPAKRCRPRTLRGLFHATRDPAIISSADFKFGE